MKIKLELKKLFEKKYGWPPNLKTKLTDPIKMVLIILAIIETPGSLRLYAGSSDSQYCKGHESFEQKLDIQPQWIGTLFLHMRDLRSQMKLYHKFIRHN